MSSRTAKATEKWGQWGSNGFCLPELKEPRLAVGTVELSHPRAGHRTALGLRNTIPTPPPPGLSPDLQSMEQIRRIMRPTDVPDQGLLCDLLWSDPDKDVQGWGENDRGVSFTFGAEVVAKFLHKHDLDLICRAHQVGWWPGAGWGWGWGA